MSEELDPRIVNALKELFNEYASNGILSFDQLGELFKAYGETIPNHQLRAYASKHSISENASVGFQEFLNMMASMNGKAIYESKLMKQISSKEGLSHSGVTEKSADGTTHTLKNEEVPAFAAYINRLLRHDKDIGKEIIIKQDNEDLFTKLNDGVILCKLVNLACHDTIDERTINMKKLNKFTITENLNLAINSSKALGAYVINISAEDIHSGIPHLVLGLVWQLIRMVLFAKLNLADTPNLGVLLREGETIEDLLRLSPEDLLLRWVNYQLEKHGNTKRISNFAADLKDSDVYGSLIDRCLADKKVSSHAQIMQMSNLESRAKECIRNFDAAELSYLLTHTDITKGNAKLNTIFIANLFNNYPCLEEMEQPIEIIETREEKMYRNWLNSNGVNPKINFLYTDINDGLALLHLLSIMYKGIVDQKKVNQHPMKPNKAFLLKTENCKYALDLCKQKGINLVGVNANDIATGSRTFVLGCLYMMMRTYTLKILQDLTKDDKPMSDAEIIDWANKKSGVTIKSFKDPVIKDSMPILKLIEAIQPGSVNFSFMESDLLKNANYAISCGRKLGAVIYALPEDIVDSNPKMILTIYACLMVRCLKGSS